MPAPRPSHLPCAWLLAALLACSGATLTSFAGAADFSDPQVAIESGRDALQGEWSRNWYDGETGRLRPLELNTPKPRSTPTPSTTSRNWFGNWSFGPGLLTFLYYLAWTAIGLLILWLLYSLFRSYSRDQRRQYATAAVVDRRAHSLKNVEALPLVVDISVTDLLAEARRLYDAGDYADAIVYLFSHQLLELDRHHLLRLVKGKTNRQYLRELRRNTPTSGKLGEILEQTIALFEQVFFGKHPLRATAMAVCWQQMPQFEQLVQSSARSGEA